MMRGLGLNKMNPRDFESVLDRLTTVEEALKQAIEVIEWCGKNDKTPPYTYDESLKSTARRDGTLPGSGKTFNTPAEFARYWPGVLRGALCHCDDGGCKCEEEEKR